MEYTVDNKTKSSTFVLGKLPILIMGVALIFTGVTTYHLSQRNTSLPQLPAETIPEIKTVTALGRLEPSGEIIQLSVSSANEGNRIEELLVKEGDQIYKGQIIAILDSLDHLEAALN